MPEHLATPSMSCTRCTGVHRACVRRLTDYDLRGPGWSRSWLPLLWSYWLGRALPRRPTQTASRALRTRQRPASPKGRSRPSPSSSMACLGRRQLQRPSRQATPVPRLRLLRHQRPPLALRPRRAQHPARPQHPQRRRHRARCWAAFSELTRSRRSHQRRREAPWPASQPSRIRQQASRRRLLTPRNWMMSRAPWAPPVQRPRQASRTHLTRWDWQR
jgi:hypothetical protein